MRLSIVVITWNQLATTLHCLAGLEELMARPEVQTIVVDNGSTDGTVATLRERFPGITLIENDANRGVAYARNQGISLAGGRFVLLLDNDTEATPQAIEQLVAYAESNPQVGLTGCRLIDADGNVQDSYKPYPGLMIKVRNVLGCRHKPYEPPTNADGSLSPTYVIGACQLISREAIERVGLLDDHIFYGPEDADYCLRLAAAGFEVRYLPSVSIKHLYRRATRRRIFSPLARKHIAALLYFYRKHHRWL